MCDGTLPHHNRRWARLDRPIRCRWIGRRLLLERWRWRLCGHHLNTRKSNRNCRSKENYENYEKNVYIILYLHVHCCVLYQKLSKLIMFSSNLALAVQYCLIYINVSVKFTAFLSHAAVAKMVQKGGKRMQIDIYCVFPWSAMYGW